MKKNKIYCNIHKIQEAILTKNIITDEFYFQCGLCYNKMLLKIIKQSEDYCPVSRADSDIYLKSEK